MRTLNILVLVCVMLAASQAREKTKCEIDHAITDADLEDLRNKNLTEKLSCFAKCALGANESINSEGEINVSKLNQAVNRWIKLTEEENANLNKCLKTLSPIKSCSDVRHIVTCVENRKVTNR
ncbi:hypothetical protein WA026_019822 [Henosepilachna vigintioctopunctata]|uniref:Uncharacterized protein n=1 Tax=Henosepilachna vigintioctopunctata TaxID=420089 RepID=A0AAW1VII4_9CUCU